MVFTDQDYEEMAIIAIRKYLNKDFSDDYIRTNFKFAMNRMINKTKQIEANNSVGIKSIKEGDSSTTFDNAVNAFEVDEEIKALLPLPYMKMY